MNFWIDQVRNCIKTEGEFLAEINDAREIHLFVKAFSPYEMLKELIIGMAYGKELVLLDADFSDAELIRMGYNLDDTKRVYLIENPAYFSSIDELIVAVVTSGWKLWMFTSGTTGIPKKVLHTYATLGRNVKVNAKHEADVWAFAYRMSHMAGIQVLLQALVNKNPMVYVFEYSPYKVVQLIKEYVCTNISATPTFYRNLVPLLNGDLHFIKHITLGGEKYDVSLSEKLRHLVPSAKIHNIYASTETGSLLNTNGDAFSIPEKYKEKIKVSVTGELLIHKSLLGEFPIEGDWYNTHDLVDVKGGKLYFISRQSDLINIGGYKVNPLEVEELIQKISGVLDCVVKSKQNSVMGNILYAEIIADNQIDKKVLKHNIIKNLKEVLQVFKVPRIYHFVEEIDHTRTGKKVRK